MNRTVIVIVDAENRLQWLVAGYELDEAGLNETVSILRAALRDVELTLVRAQVTREMEAADQNDDEQPCEEDSG